MSHRDEFIAGLRALADWLAANPAAPVPPYGHHIDTFVNTDNDQEGRAVVSAVAWQVGPLARTENGETFCVQGFPGGVSWSYRYIHRDRMTRHEALMSYRGTVQPDTSPAGAP